MDYPMKIKLHWISKGCYPSANDSALLYSVYLTPIEQPQGLAAIYISSVLEEFCKLLGRVHNAHQSAGHYSLNCMHMDWTTGLGSPSKREKNYSSYRHIISAVLPGIRIDSTDFQSLEIRCG